MNVYQITIDGQSELRAAQNMAEATKAAEEAYIAELASEPPERDEAEERAYFHEILMESCQLVGELKNWPASNG